MTCDSNAANANAVVLTLKSTRDPVCESRLADSQAFGIPCILLHMPGQIPVPE